MNKEKQLELFAELLWDENKKHNIISRQADMEDIRMHIDDSLALSECPELKMGRIVDMGSGGGLPGIVLAIDNPGSNVILIESDHKKHQFLQQCIEQLCLGNCQAINCRLEEAGRDLGLRNTFDVCTARAVAELRVLLEYGMPLLRMGGIAFFWKGSRWQDELTEASSALVTLGGRYEESHQYSWSNGVKRVILKIAKVSETPEKYPRRVGQPAKRPL